MEYMLLFIWIALILMGFIFYKSKKIAYMQMIYMILVMGLNTNSADYSVYESIYYNTISGGIKSIFSGNMLFNLLNLIVGQFTNLQVVIFVISVIGISLIYKSIIYYTDKISLVFSFYMIGSFVIDATQLRNFLAMAIWLYSSKFLYESSIDIKVLKKSKTISKYYIGVLVASLIHIGFAVTFLFPVLLLCSKKVLTFVAVIINLFCFSIGIFSVLDRLMSIVSIYSGNFFFDLIYSKFKAYSIAFNQESTLLRIQLTITFFLVFIIVYKVILFGKNGFSKNKKEMLDFIVKLNLIIMCFIPLLYFSMEFYRLQRNILVIIYVSMVALLNSSSLFKRTQNIRELYVILGVFLLAFYYLYIDSIYWNFEKVFVTLFEI